MTHFLRTASRLLRWGLPGPFTVVLPHHRLQYRPGGRILVVSFDNAARAENEPFDGRTTWGEKFYLREGYSLLGVIAAAPDWYRDPALIRTLEKLRDDGFFRRFSRVVLTGGSMGGFSAAAFAPLVPGCTVIAMSPQSTLDPKKVPWEHRFPKGRARDWTQPYGEAGTGARAAGRCYVVYDSLDSLDRRHALRIARGAPDTVLLALPGGGHGVSPVLQQSGILKDLTQEMIRGEMTPSRFAPLARARREAPQYWRVLARHALARGHAAAAAGICRKGIALYPQADFSETLRRAETVAGTTGQTRNKESGYQMQAKPSHRFDHAYPNLKGTIFIVTYGRSGSTLLQNLLMTIPGCTIRGENHNIMELLWSASMRCRMAKNTWGQQPPLPTHPWYGADQMRPALFGQTMVDGFVSNILCPPWDSRWFGFKEIRYNAVGKRLPEMLDYMNFHFKNAFFVFNTRNVESVCKSAWWKDWKHEDVVKLVTDMDRRFAEYHAAHPQNTALLSYDHFSKDPEALRPLFEKLDEPFDPEKLKEVLHRRLTH